MKFSKLIFMRYILSRMTVILLSSGFCAFYGAAQNTIPEKLSHVLQTRDMESGMKLYHEITEADLKNLPDSALFDYHYLGGYLNSEIPNHEKAVVHLLEAKRLCDTSIGTHSGDYMEIMRGLGDEYMELGKYEDALAIFQEGITKSMYMREAASHDFGNLIMGLQDCYEMLGMFNEIPSHLLDAWSFWNKDEKPLVSYTYYPLWRLEQFYKRYGMLDKALSVSREIETFIKTKGGEKHPELAETLYLKGNILVEMNRIDEGIKAFQDGLAILRENKIDSSELYEMILGNLFMSLLASERYDESEKFLTLIEEYSTISNDPEYYKNALFSAVKKVNEMGNYAKAISYINTLMKLNITEGEKSLIENQRNMIFFNQDVIKNLGDLEVKFASLQSGSSEWFETGYKLSSAYYLTKALDKNAVVLNKMYNAIDVNKSIGYDYYLWVLNNLLGLCLEREEYESAFKYANENWKYISGLTDVPKDYYFDALNNHIVAKIKSNKLEGIDSDLEKVEEYYRMKYGEVSSQYATYLHNQGRAFQLEGRLDEAKAALLKSINIQNKVEGKPLDKTVKYYMEVERQLGEL